MFNEIFAFVQNKTEYLYKNSLILQKLDSLILISILAVFVLSTFAQSDFIGFFAILATCLTFINLLFKRGEKLECNKFEIFLLAYFMLVVVSLCGSSLFKLSLHGFFKVLTFFGFYLSTVQYLKNHKEKIWWIIFAIAGCVSFEVVEGLIQTVVRPEAISTWQDTTYLNPEEIINRVYGTLKPYNPNLFGGYLVATIPTLIATFGYFLYKNKLEIASIFGGITVFSMYVLFQTGCRGSYLGLFAIVVTLILLSAKFFWDKYKKAYLWIVGSLVTLGTLFVMSVTSLRARVLSIFIVRADSSNSFRMNVYNSCIHMLQDNWLLGIGLGNQNFREIYGLYMITGFDALSAYNIYLETAVESGIFSLFAFLIFLGVALREAYKFIVTTNDKLKMFTVITAFTTIIGLMIHGFVDTVFFRPQIHFIFWSMIAIITVQTKEK